MDADEVDSRVDRPEPDATGSRAVTFEERQTVPAWLGPALVGLSVPPIAAASILVFADAGVTVETTVIVAAIVVLGVVSLPVIGRSTLRTRVREDGVHFRFRPFQLSYRRIAFDEIGDVRREESRAYGYGLKRTRSGWKYVPDASEGIRIYRKGKPIFIGSKRPHELLTAIEAGRREAERSQTRPDG